MLHLNLRYVNVGGIYGKPPAMPRRMARMHPEAAGSLEQIQADHGQIICSDVFRTAEASLLACAEKRGVQPPGYSVHNFGLAIDIAVDATMKARGWTYAELLKVMEGNGWLCHRRDGKNKAEGWHFNYLMGTSFAHLTDPANPNTWEKPGEAVIQFVYGDRLSLSPVEAQMRLMDLGLYHGMIDGRIGPRSAQAIAAFQRAWKLPVDRLDARTQRVLAFVAACQRIV